jgi:hypothetical protein
MTYSQETYPHPEDDSTLPVKGDNSSTSSAKAYRRPSPIDGIARSQTRTLPGTPQPV